MRSVVWQVALLAAMFPAIAGAQSSSATRSTADGVYNRDQASRGQDVYLGQCRSCHTPEAHASATFQATWSGKPLGELFTYIRERMPKSEPGSLSDQDYIDVVSYMLRLNRMPDGEVELAPDTTALNRIRFQTTAIPVRKAP